MGFMADIIEFLNEVSDFFYGIYLETLGWVWPFWHLAGFFLNLCYLFNSLAWSFYYFSSWVSDVSSKIGNYLSWDAIWGLIQAHFPWLENIRAWFQNWWNIVWGVVSDWWNTVKPIVQGWIDTATQGFNDLKVAWSDFWSTTWPQWTTELGKLRTKIADFFTITLPTLITGGDANDLMDSKVREAEPGWRGWQDFRDKVVLFFTDPLEFIWDRFTDWFLGPEG